MAVNGHDDGSPCRNIENIGGGDGGGTEGCDTNGYPTCEDMVLTPPGPEDLIATYVLVSFFFSGFVFVFIYTFWYASFFVCIFLVEGGIFFLYFLLGGTGYCFCLPFFLFLFSFSIILL